MPNNTKNIIYLIDDDETHLVTAELFLKDEYEIRKAISGQEALDCMSNHEFMPSIILLDILMPKMDGYEIFIRIKAISTLHDIPVAFYSSLNEDSEKKHAMALGAADYIEKPFIRNDLINRIELILKEKITTEAV